MAKLEEQEEQDAPVCRCGKIVTYVNYIGERIETLPCLCIVSAHEAEALRCLGALPLDNGELS